MQWYADKNLYSKFASSRIVQGMLPRDIQEFAELFSVQKFSKDGMIIRQGEVTARMYIILDGSVTIQLEVADRFERTGIAQLGPGETVGEFVMLGNTRRTASAVASSEVIAVSAAAKSIQDKFEENTRMAAVFFKNLCEALSERLIDLNLYAKNLIESKNKKS